MKTMKKIVSIIMVLIMLLGVKLPCYAATQKDIHSKLDTTAAYLLKTVTAPKIGSIGGEWTVMGLARSSYKVPEGYFDNYYKEVEAYVKKNQGVLHKKKYTEYSRVILALTAIGKDPTNVGGYNLVEKLGDFEKTISQGINGAIFALIALDSNQYEIPENKEAKTQATRDLYIKEILKRQLTDGGFALTGDKADPDITAMALQALSKYKSRKDVKPVIEKALNCLSKIQNSKGGYESWGTENVESAAQVLVALCELGIEPTDKRFVKNGKTVVDSILSYYTTKGFKHTMDNLGDSLMATEQAFYALVGYQRIMNHESSLYDMTGA